MKRGKERESEIRIQREWQGIEKTRDQNNDTEYNKKKKT